MLHGFIPHEDLRRSAEGGGASWGRTSDCPLHQPQRSSTGSPASTRGPWARRPAAAPRPAARLPLWCRVPRAGGATARSRDLRREAAEPARLVGRLSAGERPRSPPAPPSSSPAVRLRPRTGATDAARPPTCRRARGPRSARHPPAARAAARPGAAAGAAPPGSPGRRDDVVPPPGAQGRPQLLLRAAQMTSRTSRSKKVSSAETTSEPRQPSRLEKRKNTGARFPRSTPANPHVTVRVAHRGRSPGQVIVGGRQVTYRDSCPVIIPGPGIPARPPRSPRGGRAGPPLSRPGRPAPAAAAAAPRRPAAVPSPAPPPPPRSPTGTRTAAWSRPARAARRRPA
jgi:hypothetical protein